MKIILASGSENRQEILRLAGIKFEVMVSGVDEREVKEKDPQKKVVEIALLKAKKVAEKNEGLIIGGDTFACLRKRIMEKPKDLREARKMLKALSGKQSQMYTGLCVINTQTKEVYKKLAVTKVWFRKLTEAEIEDYVQTEPVLNWSAAYSPLSSKAVKFISKIEGSLSGFAHGLPMEFLIPILQKYKLAS